MGTLSRRVALLSGLSLLVWTGCNELAEPPGKALQSKLDRITTAPTAAVLAATVEGNTSTALSLYTGLIEGDENLFFSPHSITTVLGLTYGGSAGATKSEFETTLHVSNPADFHRTMNQLDRELASRGRNSQGADGEPFALLSLNQIFVNSQQTLGQAYLDLLQQEYGIGARQLDFETKPAESSRAINDWVSTATKKHIPSILADGDVKPETRVVMVNAMYFSSGWSQNFVASSTAPAPFHGLPGDASVSMMRSGNLYAPEFETAELQAVELDYSGNELSMVIIMPKGDYRAWEATLSLATLTDVRTGLEHGALLDLSIPKFETRSRRDLQPPLEARGLRSVFDPSAADLSAMSPDQLHLDFLRHEAWIDVSESGTRAAAVTAGGSAAPSAPPQPKRVIIDRPFFYLIQDKATKAVLFAGRYVKV